MEEKAFMYIISVNEAEFVEPNTFASIEWKEDDIEELIRKNIDIIGDEEESMLIVGKE